jgi:hypothetical protein
MTRLTRPLSFVAVLFFAALGFAMALRSPPETGNVIVDVFGVGVVLVLMALIGWALAAFPAGFIGMWHSMRRSRWFMAGGWVVMLVLFMLVVGIACCGGRAFISDQKRRVRTLEAELSETEMRFRSTAEVIR